MIASARSEPGLHHGSGSSGQGGIMYGSPSSGSGGNGGGARDGGSYHPHHHHHASHPYPGAGPAPHPGYQPRMGFVSQPPPPAHRQQQQQPHHLDGDHSEEKDAPFERPRVRADGPGGPEVKQGARIACLDCRTAKIRCSAPTDGKVPCKRCSRHGKECIFEKHRRGRKPGRASQPAREGSSKSADSNHAPQAPYAGPTPAQASSWSRPNGHGRYSDGQVGYGAPMDYDAPAGAGVPPLLQRRTGYNSLGGGGSHPSPLQPSNSAPPSQPWSSSSRSQPDSPSEARSANGDGRPPGARLPTRDLQAYTLAASPGGVASSPTSRVGSLHGFPASFAQAIPGAAAVAGGLGGASGFQTPAYNRSAPFPHMIQMPPPRIGGIDGQTPGTTRSWLDFTSPGGRSLLSPSINLSLGASPSLLNQPLVGGSDAEGSHAGGEGGSLKRKSTTSTGYFDAVSETGRSRSSYEGGAGGENQHHRREDEARDSVSGSSSKDEGASGASFKKRARIDDGARIPGRASIPATTDDDEMYSAEEDVDQLDEDEVGGGQNDDVLSTPLRLLAHASDAAAARLEGEEQRSTGAATMGLVSPPRLPNKVPSFLSRSRPGAGSTSSSSGAPFNRTLPSLCPVGAAYGRRTMMSPPFRPLSRSHGPEPPSHSSSSTSPPASHSGFRGNRGAAPIGLAGTGRSRSYTAVEGAHATARAKAQEEVLAAVVAPSGSGTNSPPSGLSTLVGVQPSAAVPSTEDHQAWEYRDGKVRIKRSSQASSAAPSAGEESGGGQSSVAGSGSGAGRDGSAAAGEEQAGPAPLEASTSDKEGSLSGSGNGKDSSAGGSGHASGGVASLWLGGHRNARSGTPTNSKGLLSIRRRSRAGEELSREHRASLVSAAAAAAAAAAESAIDENDNNEEAGASHRDFFALSVFHSKLDNDEQLDPVDLGMIELREVEKLFDIFFARINPLLNLFDPFLHSVAYVRSRSALLMTVITSLAARLSDSPRDAELAVLMERHWRQQLLPEVLLGGYKSIEIAQAQLLLSLYHKPTNRLADDRSWQYLGFAIRTATEVGINRYVTPGDGLRDTEQVRRRIRNRSRTWFNLFLADRMLSSQTGRMYTIGEDAMILGSGLWHREDFACPEDVSIVALIRLRRITTQHSEALDAYIKHPDQPDGASGDPLAPINTERRLAGLELFRKTANMDLERWHDDWVISTSRADESAVRDLAMGDFLVRWRPTAELWYSHARLYLNSIVLQAMEQLREAELAVPVARDCWDSAIALLDVLLNDMTQEELESSPNQTAVMATWAALAALRLTRLDHERHEWADRDAIMKRAKALATSLAAAGRSPAHRNGAAGPYGSYLRSVLTLWESPERGVDRKGSNSTLKAAAAGPVAAAGEPTTSEAQSKQPKNEADEVKLEKNTSQEASSSAPLAASQAPASQALPPTQQALQDSLAAAMPQPLAPQLHLDAVGLVGPAPMPVIPTAAAAAAAVAALPTAVDASAMTFGDPARLGSAFLAGPGGPAVGVGPAATVTSLNAPLVPTPGAGADVWDMTGAPNGGAAAGALDGSGLGAAPNAAAPPGSNANVDQSIDRFWDLGFPTSLWPQTAWGGFPC